MRNASKTERLNRQIRELTDTLALGMNDIPYWTTLEKWDRVYEHAQRIAKKAIETMATLKVERVI